MRTIPSVLVGSLLLAVAPSGVAHAHADVVQTSPRNGSVLERAPRAITVDFSEEVTVDSARIQGADGRVLPSAGLVAGSRLTITPTATLRGERTVTASWTVASDDGHRVSGAIAFVVDAAPPSGSRITLNTVPSVRTVLTRNRPGVTAVELDWPATSGEVQWVSDQLTEPLTWPVLPSKRGAVARGVLPWPGLWAMRATLVNRQGSVLEATAKAVVTP